MAELSPAGGDLAELERLMGGVLATLDAAGRRRLLGRIARDLRQSTSRRVAAQRNPDGSRFEKRKPIAEKQVGGYPLRFLYPQHGAGTPRLVRMKSWVREGPLVTGFDIAAGALRSFEWSRITKFLPPDPEDASAGGGKLRQRRTIRQAAMFRKIRRAGLLNAGADDWEAWIGFAGRIAAVARIHQFGEMDKPALNAREVRYARRELLGLSPAEREALLDSAIRHIEAGAK